MEKVLFSCERRIINYDPKNGLFVTTKDLLIRSSILLIEFLVQTFLTQNSFNKKKATR